MAEYKKYYSEEYREEFLEVSDERILWEIDVRDLTDEHYFYSLCDKYCEELSKHYHTFFYCCGRSGRHVCIDDTPANRRNYKYICKRVNDMQKEIIVIMNERAKQYN